MELHVWLQDHARASIAAAQGIAPENVNEEEILREVAGAVERFTHERYGVTLSVELAE